MSLWKKTTDRRSRKNPAKLARLGDLANRQHRLRLEPLEDRRMLAVLHVVADALAGGDGLTWDSAYDDLQLALDQAELLNTDEIETNNVDQIWIAEGIYIPTKPLDAENPRTATFSLLDNVTLYGGFEGNEFALDQRDWTAHETILSGRLWELTPGITAAYTVVYGGNVENAVIDGVTITGGSVNNGLFPETPDFVTSIPGAEHQSKGGGVYLDSGSLTITNTLITKNSSLTGGGVYNRDGDLTISHSTLCQNSASYHSGGGIQNGSGKLTVTDCHFISNGALYGSSGGGLAGGSGPCTVVNSVFWGNGADIGGAMVGNGNLKVTNCTVSNNRASVFGGGILGSPTVTNSIVSQNHAWQDPDVKGTLDAGSDSNLIGVDVEFIRTPSKGPDNVWGTADDDLGDLHLMPGSPGIDTGSNALAVDADGNPLLIDLAGNPRIQHSTVDIGAYESVSVLFVDADAAVGRNGLAWESAYDNLQLALDKAELLNTDETTYNDIYEIWIAEGMYIPTKLLEAEDARSASFSLLNNVALFGGFEGNETAINQRDWTTHETILSGDLGIQNDASDNAYTVVYCGENIEATLDGVSVTGGNAADMSSDSNGLERKSGGGILNVGILTVSNSIVSDNLARFCGGGIYNAANLTVANSTVFANSALSGGGIFSSGNLTIHDSTLSGNSATGSGGGIISLGNLTAVNIMVSENSAEDGGGLYTQGDNSTIDNSTIMSNRSRGKTCYGGGIFTSGNLAVTNSIVSNNFTTSRVDGSKAYGGGVYNSGALVVTDSTIANNFCTSSGFRSYSRGGGIYNNGCLTVSNSSIHRNTAQGDCYTFYSGGLGGGIFNNGNLTVSHATLSENSAEESAGGICNLEEMTVSYSTFFNNSADQSGGAISNYCNMTVTGSLFQGNRSGQDGGAIANLQSAEMMTVSDSTFIGNFAEIGGGGIHNWGKGTVSESTFTDNRANGHGGAIGNPGTLDLSGLMVSGNYSSGIRWRGNYIDCYMGVGGGISNEMTMTITNSTIIDNFARYGGGMGNISGGSLTVANSTISGNTAEVFGGGVYSSGSRTTIFHATIIDNVAGRDGGGIYDVERIGNTVIAGNIAPEHPDINVSISSINFVGTEDGDPMLTAITDEMGRLLYYRPQSGSPLIDAGRTFQYTRDQYRIKLDYDQLGNLRLTDPPPAAVDIGSIELQATPELAVTPSPYFEIHEGESITVDVCLTAVPEGTIEVAIEKQADSSDEITADLSTILFDTTNWNIPQTLTLSMAGEVDPGTDQSAVFSLSAPGMNTVRLFLTRPTDSRTYVVTSLADVVAEDGQVTLREAIEAANTNTAVGDALPGSDSQEGIIIFDPALFAEGSATITLSGTQLEITDHLIISGPGEELLTIDANALSRLFYVDHFASATLEGLTLTGGAAEDGGAIFGFGMSLTINECTISKNSAKDYGGGVLFAGAQLIVNDSAVCENSASSGGGIYIDKGIAKINDSLLMGNLATGFNGGGGISSDGLLTLTGSTIRENSAIKDYAGGILNAGQMTISFSSICKNFSSGSGGGILNAGQTAISFSSICKNFSSGGGGIHNGGSLTVTDSLISENVSSSSEGGGGIYNGAQMTVTGSTIHGNSTKSGNGGGIFNRYGQFTVINSTICGNSAENGNGGGISTADLSYYPLSTINSTIAGNVAMDGGGIFQYENITLNNSIVALNEGGQIGGIGEAPGSHNLLDTDPAFIRNPSDGGNGWGDNPDTPDIDESANDDYGDLRLRPNSPAIDAGDNSLAVDAEGNPLTTDLDGKPRIFGGTIDIGAYESDVNAPPRVVEVTIGQGNGRSAIRRIEMFFHEAVLDLLNADVLQLSNLTTGEAIPADVMTVEVDPTTCTATWTFPGLPGGRLPNGNYSANILADAVVDPTGNPMAADYTFEFHSFFGDSDGDRDVDFADLFHFRKTYQKTSADVGFDSRFDTDADGDVDTADLFAFRQNYLKALGAPVTTSSPIEATAPISSRMQQAALLPFLTSINTTPPEITYGPVQRHVERGIKVSHDFFANRVGLPEPVSREPLTTNSTLDEGLLNTLAMDLQQRQANTKKSDKQESEQEELLAVAYADYE